MDLVSVYKDHFYGHNRQSAWTTNPPGSNHGSLSQRGSNQLTLKLFSDKHV